MNVDKNRDAFEAWLYLGQTQYEPDDLNKREKEIAQLAFNAAIEIDRQGRGEPVKLIHMAVIDEGELRMMSGRRPVDCELYAMPDLGSAPMLYLAPQPAEPVKETSVPDAAIEAIAFALENDEGMDFLRCWNEGNFDAIRREWPEAPETVFIGADPLHPLTVIGSPAGGQAQQEKP